MEANHLCITINEVSDDPEMALLTYRSTHSPGAKVPQDHHPLARQPADPQVGIAAKISRGKQALKGKSETRLRQTTQSPESPNTSPRPQSMGQNWRQPQTSKGCDISQHTSIIYCPDTFRTTTPKKRATFKNST